MVVAMNGIGSTRENSFPANQLTLHFDALRCTAHIQRQDQGQGKGAVELIFFGGNGDEFPPS